MRHSQRLSIHVHVRPLSTWRPHFQYSVAPRDWDNMSFAQFPRLPACTSDRRAAISPLMPHSISKDSHSIPIHPCLRPLGRSAAHPINYSNADGETDPPEELTRQNGNLARLLDSERRAHWDTTRSLNYQSHWRSRLENEADKLKSSNEHLAQQWATCRSKFSECDSERQQLLELVEHYRLQIQMWQNAYYTLLNHQGKQQPRDDVRPHVLKDQLKHCLIII